MPTIQNSKYFALSYCRIYEYFILVTSIRRNTSLSFAGDILGSTRTNLGNLLKIPTGCGEQNMLNFAPNVFVTLYLQQINRLSEEMRTTASRHIVDGYMNQLRLDFWLLIVLHLL